MRAVPHPRTVVLTLTLLLIGLFALPSPARAVSSVLGGERATYGPWAVRMMIDGKPACTGTALSEEWIISASHCFFDQPDQEFTDEQITYRFGALDIREATEVKVIAGSRVSAPNLGDVMMIKVEKMRGITPAKLSIKKVKPGTRVRVLGWGAFCNAEDPNDCQSKRLKQAEGRTLNIKKNQDLCQGFGTVNGRSLCVRNTKGAPMPGDSGAPMMTIAPKGKERLVGVFWGANDEIASAEKVLPIQKWIRKTLKK